MSASHLILVCTVLAFLLGAIPFAVWLTRIVAHSDARTVGDGNPGTGNAFKAGGWRAGVPVLVLEVGKAGVPVGMAKLTLGLSGWALAPVAVAPILGHAFSPFLAGKGGKAVAATFGSWAGLTGYLGPAALALCMGVFYALQTVNSLTVLGGMVLFGIFLLSTGAPLALIVVWLCNLAIIAYKQRGEFSLSFSPRSWLRLPARRNG